MIEFIAADLCTGCDACVRVCPTNVFEPAAAGPPRIARPDQCQTCFICELYCDADALYVGPDYDWPGGLTPEEVRARGLLGQYRRDSGWGERANDPARSNEHWRMGQIFERARAMKRAGR